MTRVVFMGTPAFAVPSLKALVEAGYCVAGVFTQPDRPAGRGKKLTACPVKACAEEFGLKVIQVEKVRSAEGLEQMRALAPDVIVTAAFGQILTAELLAVPKYGTVNVHASLLPQHRGSAPINRCIICGDKVAGVTTMLTDVGIDTGDMLLEKQTEVGETETAGELTARLSEMGAELLIETLDGYLKGEIRPRKQDDSKATYEPMLTKEFGIIDWMEPAKTIACKINGLNPWPCAVTTLPQGKLKLLRAGVSTCANEGAIPGTVLISGPKDGLVVACGEGCVELLEIQAQNSKAMASKAYLMGKKIDVGTVLGEKHEG